MTAHRITGAKLLLAVTASIGIALLVVWLLSPTIRDETIQKVTRHAQPDNGAGATVHRASSSSRSETPRDIPLGQRPEPSDSGPDAHRYVSRPQSVTPGTEGLAYVPPPAKNELDADSKAAWDFAVEAVQGRLTRPEDARFPRLGETGTAVEHTGERYTVKGFVHARTDSGQKRVVNFTALLVRSAGRFFESEVKLGEE